MWWQVDPFHYDLRIGLAAAQQGVLADLLSGLLNLGRKPVSSCTGSCELLAAWSWAAQLSSKAQLASDLKAKSASLLFADVSVWHRQAGGGRRGRCRRRRRRSG